MVIMNYLFCYHNLFSYACEPDINRLAFMYIKSKKSELVIIFTFIIITCDKREQTYIEAV